MLVNRRGVAQHDPGQVARGPGGEDLPLEPLLTEDGNVADVVDVLVVTLLLYALLVLLRGTRAMQMLWGILIITGLYFFSRAADLITLSSILGNLLAFLPIAIIVLFQREIRSMLAAFGSRSLLRWKSGQEDGTAPLNELALAVQALFRGSVDDTAETLKPNTTCWFTRMSSMRGRLTVFDAARRSK